MTHTPLAIAVGSMYFSLKYHGINHLMPGGLQWYTRWTISEEQIRGQLAEGNSSSAYVELSQHFCLLSVDSALRIYPCYSPSA